MQILYGEDMDFKIEDLDLMVYICIFKFRTL